MSINTFKLLTFCILFLPSFFVYGTKPTPDRHVTSLIGVSTQTSKLVTDNNVFTQGSHKIASLGQGRGVTTLAIININQDYSLNIDSEYVDKEKNLDGHIYGFSLSHDDKFLFVLTDVKDEQSDLKLVQYEIVNNKIQWLKNTLLHFEDNQWPGSVQLVFAENGNKFFVTSYDSRELRVFSLDTPSGSITQTHTLEDEQLFRFRFGAIDAELGRLIIAYRDPSEDQGEDCLLSYQLMEDGEVDFIDGIPCNSNKLASRSNITDYHPETQDILIGNSPDYSIFRLAENGEFNTILELTHFPSLDDHKQIRAHLKDHMLVFEECKQLIFDTFTYTDEGNLERGFFGSYGNFYNDNQCKRHLNLTGRSLFSARENGLNIVRLDNEDSLRHHNTKLDNNIAIEASSQLVIPIQGNHFVGVNESQISLIDGSESNNFKLISEIQLEENQSFDQQERLYFSKLRDSDYLIFSESRFILFSYDAEKKTIDFVKDEQLNDIELVPQSIRSLDATHIIARTKEDALTILEFTENNSVNFYPLKNDTSSAYNISKFSTIEVIDQEIFAFDYSADTIFAFRFENQRLTLKQRLFVETPLHRDDQLRAAGNMLFIIKNNKILSFTTVGGIKEASTTLTNIDPLDVHTLDMQTLLYILEDAFWVFDVDAETGIPTRSQKIPYTSINVNSHGVDIVQVAATPENVWYRTNGLIKTIGQLALNQSPLDTKKLLLNEGQVDEYKLADYLVDIDEGQNFTIPNISLPLGLVLSADKNYLFYEGNIHQTANAQQIKIEGENALYLEVEYNAAPQLKNGNLNIVIDENEPFRLPLQEEYIDRENDTFTLTTELPSGVTLASDFVLSGTVSGIKEFTAEIQARDTRGASSNGVLKFQVNPAPIVSGELNYIFEPNQKFEIDLLQVFAETNGEKILFALLDTYPSVKLDGDTLTGRFVKPGTYTIGISAFNNQGAKVDSAIIIDVPSSESTSKTQKTTGGGGTISFAMLCLLLLGFALRRIQ